MNPLKSLHSMRTLTAATPLAFAAVLLSAAQASAGISDATLANPHVIDQGSALSVVFGSAVTNAATDDAIAQNVAAVFAGTWVGGLIQTAAQNTPPSAAACQVTVTATDPDGATGTVTAAVPTGVADNELAIPDQASGTKWGVGDFDHFTVQLTCTDTARGNETNRTTIAEDQTAN